MPTYPREIGDSVAMPAQEAKGGRVHAPPGTVRLCAPVSSPCGEPRVAASVALALQLSVVLDKVTRHVTKKSWGNMLWGGDIS